MWAPAELCQKPRPTTSCLLARVHGIRVHGLLKPPGKGSELTRNPIARKSGPKNAHFGASPADTLTAGSPRTCRRVAQAFPAFALSHFAPSSLRCTSKGSSFSPFAVSLELDSGNGCSHRPAKGLFYCPAWRSSFVTRVPCFSTTAEEQAWTEVLCGNRTLHK